MTQKFRKVSFNVNKDPRGNLTAIEIKDYVNWEPKRIYYVTETLLPRGGHAVRGEKKFYVVMQGSATAKIHDGKEWSEFEMKGPNEALIMDEMCWREFHTFAPNTVLMAVSNMNYDRSAYIMDFDQFVKESNL
jgi:hypothetical protein